MTFGSLDRVWLAALIAAVTIVSVLAIRSRRSRLTAATSQGALGRSFGRNWRSIDTAKLVFRILSATAVAVALLRPLYGTKVEPVSAETADLVIALDLSRSMMAEDLRPSRLTRVKQEIESWLRQRHPWRVALVGFEGVPAVFSPLTTDHEAVAEILHGLDSGEINIPGTDIASALETSIRLMDAAQSASQILLLVTDGEDHSKRFEKAVAVARARQVRLFVAAVGSVDGAPIPLAGGGFVKDGDGDIVISKMDEEVLMEAARTTNGALLRIDNSGADFEPLFAAMEQARKTQWSINEHRPLEERFQIPLLIAFMLISVEPLLGLLRSPRKAGALGALAFVAVHLSAHPAVADTFDDGMRQYNDSQYSESVKSFLQSAVSDPKNPVVVYNLGNALFRAGQYPTAVSAYATAATAAEDPALKFEALYNAGNASFRANSLDQAIFFYRQALQIDPDDEDARVNLEVAKRKLREHAQKQAMRQQQQAQQQPSDKQTDPNGEQKQSDAGQTKKPGEDKKGEGDQRREAQEKKKAENEQKGGDPKKKGQNPLADKMLDRIQEPDKRPHKETRTRGSGMEVEQPW